MEQFLVVVLVMLPLVCGFDHGEGDLKQLEHIRDILMLLFDLLCYFFFDLVVFLLLCLLHLVQLGYFAHVFPSTLVILLPQITTMLIAKVE